jgi:nicotinamide riboside transporter PnuC
MTTQIVLRQKAMSVALLIAGVLAFTALFAMSGMTGHILSLFSISYNDAHTVVLAIVNNIISTLPLWEQVIAYAVGDVVRTLYHLSGLQPAIAY